MPGQHQKICKGTIRVLTPVGTFSIQPSLCKIRAWTPVGEFTLTLLCELSAPAQVIVSARVPLKLGPGIPTYQSHPIILILTTRYGTMGTGRTIPIWGRPISFGLAWNPAKSSERRHLEKP